MRRFSPLSLVLLAACTLLGASSCLRIHKRSINEVPTRQPQRVDSALRAFLSDGSVVVFLDGALISSETIAGQGSRYDLLRKPLGPGPMTIPLDSVVGIESFDQSTNVPLSLLASIGVTVLVVGGAVAIACAADPKCFGSCPTVYTYGEEGEVLEAEAFSYSVSPLLEARDVDALAAAVDEGGDVSLEIRNEALETHYINHLELLEVRHRPDQEVVTSPTHSPVVVGARRPFPWVRDRGGRDVGAEVQYRDAAIFGSSHARVVTASGEDHQDWLEAEVPAVDSDTAAVVLRLRNSLLNTILFYDFMLGRQGAAALDWMAQDLDRIGGAVELGTWFYQTMGLRLWVESEGEFREVARLGDTGPIAWKEVAFKVPVQRGEPTRIRLSFLADGWRIDRLEWSDLVQDAEVRTHAVTEIEPIRGTAEGDLLARVREADDAYLVTTAGTGFTARFHVGAGVPGLTRTFLLGSQGYYSEWVRPQWIREGDPDAGFRTGPELVPALLDRWMDVKEPMERAFHDTRIPVR